MVKKCEETMLQRGKEGKGVGGLLDKWVGFDPLTMLLSCLYLFTRPVLLN